MPTLLLFNVSYIKHVAFSFVPNLSLKLFTQKVALKFKLLSPISMNCTAGALSPVFITSGSVFKHAFTTFFTFPTLLPYSTPNCTIALTLSSGCLKFWILLFASSPLGIIRSSLSQVLILVLLSPMSVTVPVSPPLVWMTSPTLNALSKIILMPPKMFARLSFTANPIASPATPTPANNPVMSTFHSPKTKNAPKITKITLTTLCNKGNKSSSSVDFVFCANACPQLSKSICTITYNK